MINHLVEYATYLFAKYGHLHYHRASRSSAYPGFTKQSFALSSNGVHVPGRRTHRNAQQGGRGVVSQGCNASFASAPYRPRDVEISSWTGTGNEPLFGHSPLGLLV